MSTPRTSRALAGSLVLSACWPNPSEKSDYIDPTMTTSDTTTISEPTTSTTTTTHGPTSVTTVDTSTDDTTEADTSTTSTTDPTFCGDGDMDEDEECDDGNKDNTDACLDTCKAAECGDGFTQADVEGCDDGNDVDDDECTNACTKPVCGDSIVQDGEDCDDGNDVDTDPCTNACTDAKCGDGIKADVEECDDGDGDDQDECSIDCFAPRGVFITSTTKSGNLGGVSGADEICRGLAIGLPGANTYKAWLSGSTTETAPAMRFASMGFGGWYVSAKSLTPIADGWIGLTTKPLLKAILEDEKGAPVDPPDPPDEPVWSNTNASGELVDANNNCANWTSLSGDGMTKGNKGRAFSGTLDSKWTHIGSDDCNSGNYLYCFQTGP